MAISESSVSRSFMNELQWAKDTIKGLDEYKGKNWAIGLKGDTGQPDDFLVGFAARDLALVTYIRGAGGLNIGDPSAYDRNVVTVKNYIEVERQQEIKSGNDQINQIVAFKAQKWAIGLNWPDGQPDAFTKYFAARGLPIAYYLRSRIAVGDLSAYDRNIATLKDYIAKVGESAV
jgi:hypothetical protein